jgi:hypothetical protein
LRQAYFFKGYIEPLIVSRSRGGQYQG